MNPLNPIHSRSMGDIDPQKPPDTKGDKQKLSSRISNYISKKLNKKASVSPQEISVRRDNLQADSSGKGQALEAWSDKTSESLTTAPSSPNSASSSTSSLRNKLRVSSGQIKSLGNRTAKGLTEVAGQVDNAISGDPMYAIASAGWLLGEAATAGILDVAAGASNTVANGINIFKRRKLSKAKNRLERTEIPQLEEDLKKLVESSGLKPEDIKRLVNLPQKIAQMEKQIETLTGDQENSELRNELINTTLPNLREELKSLKETSTHSEANLNRLMALPREIAQSKIRMDDLKDSLKSGKSSLRFGMLASVSYLTGAIANFVSAAPAWMAPGFGSAGFGVAYAISKALDLKANYKEYKSMKDGIRECDKKIAECMTRLPLTDEQRSDIETSLASTINLKSRYANDRDRYTKLAEELRPQVEQYKSSQSKGKPQTVMTKFMADNIEKYEKYMRQAQEANTMANVMDQQIDEFNDRLENGNPKEPALAKVYELKKASLKSQIRNNSKLNMFQNVLDIGVGVAATVAGVATIAGAGAATVATGGGFALVGMLGASIAFKMGSCAFRDFSVDSKKHRFGVGLNNRASLTLKKYKLYLKSKTACDPKVRSTARFQMVAAKQSEERERFKELTKTSPLEMNAAIQALLENSGPEAMEMKQKIAESQKIVGADGNIDPHSITAIDARAWFASETY